MPKWHKLNVKRQDEGKRRFKEFSDSELLFFTILLTHAKNEGMDEAVKKSLNDKLGGKMQGTIDTDDLIKELINEASTNREMNP